MGALLFLYSTHPVAGWTLLAALAAMTAVWRSRRAEPALDV
jgi:hypothetical protein